MQEVLSQVSKLAGQMGNLNSKVQAVLDRMMTLDGQGGNLAMPRHIRVECWNARADLPLCFPCSWSSLH